MTGWQPIETAPEDVSILVYCEEENEMYVVFYEDGVFWRRGSEPLDPESPARDETPTHWMPLPEPPK